MSQSAAKLQRSGWLTRKSDRGDARRSVLDLSAEGERRLGGLGPIWCAIRAQTGVVMRSSGPLLEAIGKLEIELADGRVLRDVLASTRA